MIEHMVMGYAMGRRWIVAGMVFTSLWVAGACGNVTSGGFGEAEVVMSSGESGGAAAPSGAPSGASGGGATATSQAAGTSHAPQLTGTLSVRVRTFARSRGGAFVELTNGFQELTLPLADPSPLGLAVQSLPAGEYDAVRTVFERIEAQVLGGLVIGGQPITGTVRVDLGTAGSLTIDTETDFEVWENATTVIALDMRSAAWMPLAGAQGLVWLVDSGDFRGAFRVRVR